MTLKRKWAHAGWLCCLILIVAVGCNDKTLSEPFQQRLSEAGLIFTQPQGFKQLPPVANPLLPYEHAIRSQDGKLETRYAIRPLSRVTIDYSDPHNSAPEPNHLFNMYLPRWWNSCPAVVIRRDANIPASRRKNCSTPIGPLPQYLMSASNYHWTIPRDCWWQSTKMTRLMLIWFISLIVTPKLNNAFIRPCPH